MLERVVALALFLFALVWAASIVGTPDDPARANDVAPPRSFPAPAPDDDTDHAPPPGAAPAPAPPPARPPAQPPEPAPDPAPTKPKKEKGLLGGLLGPG